MSAPEPDAPEPDAAPDARPLLATPEAIEQLAYWVERGLKGAQEKLLPPSTDPLDPDLNVHMGRVYGLAMQRGFEMAVDTLRALAAVQRQAGQGQPEQGEGSGS